MPVANHLNRKYIRVRDNHISLRNEKFNHITLIYSSLEDLNVNYSHENCEIIEYI